MQTNEKSMSSFWWCYSETFINLIQDNRQGKCLEIDKYVSN